MLEDPNKVFGNLTESLNVRWQPKLTTIVEELCDLVEDTPSLDGWTDEQLESFAFEATPRRLSRENGLAPLMYCSFCQDKGCYFCIDLLYDSERYLQKQLRKPHVRHVVLAAIRHGFESEFPDEVPAPPPSPRLVGVELNPGPREERLRKMNREEKRSAAIARSEKKELESKLAAADAKEQKYQEERMEQGEVVSGREVKVPERPQREMLDTCEMPRYFEYSEISLTVRSVVSCLCVMCALLWVNYYAVVHTANCSQGFADLRAWVDRYYSYWMGEAFFGAGVVSCRHTVVYPLKWLSGVIFVLLSIQIYCSITVQYYFWRFIAFESVKGNVLSQSQMGMKASQLDRDVVAFYNVYSYNNFYRCDRDVRVSCWNFFEGCRNAAPVKEELAIHHSRLLLNNGILQPAGDPDINANTSTLIFQWVAMREKQLQGFLLGQAQFIRGATAAHLLLYGWCVLGISYEISLNCLIPFLKLGVTSLYLFAPFQLIEVALQLVYLLGAMCLAVPFLILTLMNCGVISQAQLNGFAQLLSLISNISEVFVVMFVVSCVRIWTLSRPIQIYLLTIDATYDLFSS